MDQPLDRLSTYFEAWNIRNRRHHSVFTWQLARYFRAQQQSVEHWEETVDDECPNLAAVEEDLYRRFGISSQSLRYFAELQKTQTWDRSQAAIVIDALGHIQLQALNGSLNLKLLAFNRLHVIDPTVGHILTVSTDPAARGLMPFDMVGWERALNGIHEGARVTNAKSDGGVVMPSQIKLSASQVELLEPLRAFWRIKQEGRRIAGYNPRPIPLLVGPSGSGKTALVRHFAALEKLPMKDFNVGTWLVSGARAEPQTLCEIADFLRTNDRGVLFIDEVDKLYGDTDWSRHVQQEIYALLDARTDSFPNWEKSFQEKLVRNFFIVGAGTWQGRYAGRQRSLGFARQTHSDRWEIDVEAQNEIPEELLMRFNADVLHLRPLTKGEFASRISEIHRGLKIPQFSEERLSVLAEKAVASGRHNRWLEAYVSRRLREAEENFVEPELLHVVRQTSCRRR